MIWATRRARSQLKIVLVTGFFLAGFGAIARGAQDRPEAPLTAVQVVERMLERNEQRALALQGYRGKRVYNLEYRGWTSKSATLVVAMSYRRPDEKTFCIVSESGSELLQKRVLKRLLEAEVGAMQEEQRRLTAMNQENYEFRLLAFEQTTDRGFYLLEVTPRTKNKFLFRGRIWVDAQDFAVARMDGEPAKNPSWWTKRNAIKVTYEKVGDFWLPARNETNTQVRIAGRSQLTIVYQAYEIQKAGIAIQIIPASADLLPCPVEPAKLTASQP